MLQIIASRMKSIQSSATLMIAKRASELKQQGKQIISLSIGELDFDTPNNIKDSAIMAIQQGFTKYTNVDGTPELKRAVQHKFKVENNLEYKLDEIIVSAGAKQVIFNLMLATLNTEDEVIIPIPYWVSYSDIVSLAGGRAVHIHSSIENNFKITIKQLESAITSKTRWLLLNSPNNPTGAIYSEKELQSIATFLSHHDNIHIMCDDIYEHIIFDNHRFYTLASVAPQLRDRIFTVNGVSKAYAMTGWRIGYGAGHQDIIKAMTKIQSHSTSNPCSISQAAAVAALTGPQELIQVNARILQDKRDLAFDILSNIDGLTCSKPAGAFYLFVGCHKLLGKKSPGGMQINSSGDLAYYLLNEVGISVVPGEAFGISGYFRVSYSLDKEQLRNACLLIKSACEQLVT